MKFGSNGRIVAIGFCFLLLLTACGKKDEPQPVSGGSQPQQTPVPEPDDQQPTPPDQEPTPQPPRPAPQPTPPPAPQPPRPAPQPTPQPPRPAPQPTPPPPAPPPTPRPPQPAPPVYSAAMWSRVRNSNEWTEIVYLQLRRKWEIFETARDVETYCPGYLNADRRHREICWLRLIGGIVHFESSYNPNDAFREPNNGPWSVGLMALSPGECPNAPTVNDLKNPVKNLECAMNIMARLIARDGMIDGPPRARGASAYWSTLREPYTAHGYQLGKKDKIIEMTERFTRY